VLPGRVANAVPGSDAVQVHLTLEAFLAVRLQGFELDRLAVLENEWPHGNIRLEQEPLADVGQAREGYDLGGAAENVRRGVDDRG
jgi:hypothetical protein